MVGPILPLSAEKCTSILKDSTVITCFKLNVKMLLKTYFVVLCYFNDNIFNFPFVVHHSRKLNSSFWNRCPL